MPSDDLLDLIALSLVPGLGPRLTQALVDHFGTAAEVRRAKAGHLEEVPHIGAKLARSFADALAEVDPMAEYQRSVELGVRLLTLNSPDYPASLKSVPDAPHLLYVRGEITSADDAAVAIVGSRQCTSYGIRMASKIAASLGRAGYTVVSGLALGIDGAAHRGALDGGGRTIAVLAGGLSAIYPPEHVDLANEVAAKGALITETPLSMAPQRGMFHARNRLISGLGRAVVVIEANDRSGALITARHAIEQGREIFAVPGNVDSPQSAGTLSLLRDGAKLIRNADDLLDDLNALAQPVRPAPSVGPPRVEVPKPAPTLTDPLHQRLWDMLAEPRHMDEIIRAMGLSIGELNKLLITLEMKKLIRRAPGSVYERR